MCEGRRFTWKQLLIISQMFFKQKGAVFDLFH